MNQAAHEARKHPGLRWYTHLIGAAVLTFPCVSGCATLAQDEPRAATGQLPGLPAPRLSLDNLVALTRQGLGADAIIDRIRQSGDHYRLSAADVISLRERGLPIAVIDHMLASERQFLARGGAGTAPTAATPLPAAAKPRPPIPALYTGV